MSSPSVFHCRCGWCNTPFAPFYNRYWLQECTSSDVQHRRHGCQRTVRTRLTPFMPFVIPLHKCEKTARYGGWLSNVAWPLQLQQQHHLCRKRTFYMSRALQSRCFSHPRRWPPREHCKKQCGQCAVSIEKRFAIYTRNTSSRATRIEVRALTCYYATPFAMSAASKFFRAATKRGWTRRTRTHLANLQIMFTAEKTWTYLLISHTVWILLAAFLASMEEAE